MASPMRTLARRVLTITLATIFAAVMLPALGASAAPAQDDCYPDGCTEPTNPPDGDDDPTVDITPDVDVAGVLRTVVYADFAGGATIEFSFDVAGLSGFLPTATALTTDVADATGAGEFEVAIPAGTAVGDYVLSATDGVDTATTPFSVVADGDDGDDSGGGLAFTGSTILPLVLLGLALVAVGYYLRRQRGTATA